MRSAYAGRLAGFSPRRRCQIRCCGNAARPRALARPQQSSEGRKRGASGLLVSQRGISALRFEGGEARRADDGRAHRRAHSVGESCSKTSERTRWNLLTAGRAPLTSGLSLVFVSRDHAAHDSLPCVWRTSIVLVVHRRLWKQPRSCTHSDDGRARLRAPHGQPRLGWTRSQRR